MTGTQRPRRFLWKLIRLPPRLLYRLGLSAHRPGGAPVDDCRAQVGSAAHDAATVRRSRRRDLHRRCPRPKADWFRNIVTDPQVEVQVKSRRFRGVAEPVTDPAHIADFLELRLQRHPRMMGAILRSAGLPSAPGRAQLEQYAAGLALVVIRPRW